jgi:hypothetical protein
MAAFWAVFIFGGSGPAITAHGSFDLKQIQIQIQIMEKGNHYGFREILTFTMVKRRLGRIVTALVCLKGPREMGKKI